MAKKRPFRIQDVNAVREIGAMDATADGKLVAFAASETSSDGEKMIGQVWLLDAETPEGARPITAEESRAGLPRFSPDGTKLAYLAVGTSKDDEKGRRQLVVLTAPFSEPRTVTRLDAGVRYFEWLTDSRFMVLAESDAAAKKRKKADEEKRDAYEVDADEPRTSLFIVSAAGGKAKPVSTKGGHVAVASASPDGKSIAYVACRHSTLSEMWKGSELYVLNVRTGRSRLLRKMSTPVSAMYRPQFSPDGTRLAVIDGIRKGMIYPHRIYVLALDGKRAVTVDRRVDRFQSAPKWLDEGNVSYLMQDGVSRKLRVAPASGGAGRDLVDWPGSILDHVWHGPILDHARADEAARVFFVYSETDRPGELYSLDVAAGGEPERLTSLNRKLHAIRHAKGETVRWKSREGWTVEGLFMRPTKNVRAPWATVVIPHGGPHGAISDEYARLNAQVFCARGYAVFLPNFRGSTGYGTKFLLSIRKNWGGAPADDIVRGIRYLVRRKLVDAKRIVVNGGSYGGYMTAWLIGHYPMFRAAVAHAPVVNNISMWGTTDIPSFKEWSYGGRPLANFRLYWQQSPISALKGVKTPTLVLVGDVDLRVPVGQAQELYRTVQAEGAPAKLVRYPREPHGIGEPRHKTDVIGRTLAWFKEHLGKDSPDR